MLKWLRKYNKYILVFGGSLLMVTFLLTGPLTRMLKPSPQTRPLGNVADIELTFGDRQAAAHKIAQVSALHPIVAQLAPREPLAWLLMLQEAKQLGISASNYDVDSLLSTLGTNANDLKHVARNMSVTTDELRETLRQWIIIENYKEIVRGSIHESVAFRVNQMAAIFKQFEMVQKMQGFMQQYYRSMLFQELARIQQGRSRISPVMLEHFIADQQTRVKIAMVRVPAEHYLAKANTPTEAQIQKLYDDYKDQLVGQSKPFGFGYRFPNGVKLEYLALPIDRLKEKVSIAEHEALKYYDTHLKEFTIAPPALPKDAAKNKAPVQPQVQAYKTVRTRILTQLHDKAARQLGDEMIRAAQTLFLKNARPLTVSKGYRKVTSEWRKQQKITFEEVAKRLQKQFDLLPTVVRFENHLLDKEMLTQLPAIGQTSIVNKPQVTFAKYALSVKKITTGPDGPLFNLRLQKHLPSLPMQDADGSLYLFRITHASPTRQPHSLDEVKTQVVKDATRLAAYQFALTQVANWKTRLTKDSLARFAGELKQQIEEPRAFPTKDFSRGRVDAPEVGSVGRDDAFTKQVFELVSKIGQKDNLATLPPDKRSGIVHVDRNLSLYIVRIDEVHRLKKSDYQRAVTMPQIANLLQQSLQGDDAKDPFSLDELKRRTGFVEATK